MKPLLLLALLSPAAPAFGQQTTISFDEAYQGAPVKDMFQSATADKSGVAPRAVPVYEEKVVAPIDATAELPMELFPGYSQDPQRVHLIFRDAIATDARGYPDTREMAYWRFQAQSIERQLTERGVPKERIHIIPVRSLDDYHVALRGFPGPKSMYVFGHAGPLRLAFGDARVDLRQREEVEALTDNDVLALCHYGCRFLAEDKTGLATLRELLRGRPLTLVGHRNASTAFDDSARHPTNPLVELSVGPDSCPAREF